MRRIVCLVLVSSIGLISRLEAGHAAHPLAAPGITSLTDASIKYRVAETHHVMLQRGDVTAILVDNAAVDVPELPDHRAGYNGIASLMHRNQPVNLFVPFYAGLNFEHIHDGSSEGLIEKFEPRKFPMELRIVGPYTVELYQAPTGNCHLESCGRYVLLEDGAIEYTFECIPHAGDYRNGYIGLFWASYIQSPEDKAVTFKGRLRGTNDAASWVKGVTPHHGTDSTHGPAAFLDLVSVDSDFPLTLVNHPSQYVYTEPWYFGLSREMAFVQIFRKRDRIWLAQSPSGAGPGNPAWDFQWFIPNYRVGDAYGFRMRAAYVPYESHEQVERVVHEHSLQLNR